MIRVRIPGHLQTLARVSGELEFELGESATIQDVLGAIEERYPMLRGTIRSHGTLERRAFVRFFACERDLSREPVESMLPEPVLQGREPFIVMGAMAGGSRGGSVESRSMRIAKPGL